MAYIGYFRSLHNDYLYSVIIRKKGDTSTPKEILLSGEEPFRVSYSDSSTIFEPIRTSVATIKIVSNSYLEDILPSKAHETEVILNSQVGDKSVTNWVGYLTPKIYSQGYEDEYETIELEAADVLSSLQYSDYTDDGTRGLSTFKDIIARALQDTLIGGFYWPTTKLLDGTIITPEMLKISDKNFYSSDTDEPWHFQDVLSEICKYMGLTCIQWGDRLYFMDYGALSNINYRFEFLSYLKAANWGQSSSKWSGVKRTINEQDIMGNGENISFEPVYDKIVVKDNFYTCNEYIANIFDDSVLTNRGEDFYSSFQLEAPPTYNGKKLSNFPTYPWGTSWFSQKYVNDGEKGDDAYYYWHRLYDHRDYESVYRSPSDLSVVELSDDEKNNQATTQQWVGATICDFGRVEKDYYDENYNKIVANSIEWDRYLLISQCGKGWISYTSPYAGQIADNMVVYQSKPGSRGQVLLDDKNSFLIIDYKIMFEKYKYRNYINPTWENKSAKKGGLDEGGQMEYAAPLAFRLGIGGKYWSGNKWRDNSATTFTIATFRDEESFAATYNKEMEVLNNVSWDLNIDIEGYKIPLEGVDTGGEFIFQIFLPKLQLVTDYDDLDPTSYNQYCWVKDFKISTATIDQDKEVEENDIVYENVIDEDSQYKLNEIELKFTTSVPSTKPSYSNVVYWDGKQNRLLTHFDENVLPDKGMKAEENIIQRYYQQYSTPTKKLSYTLGIDNTPFDKYMGVDIENPDTGYVVSGLDIDYSRDKQIMTLVQKK